MNQRVISMHYTLTDPKGQVLDSSANQEPLTYLEGSGQIIKGLETAILALKKGDKKKIPVSAKDAYGEHSKQQIISVPRSQFPRPDIKIGDQFQGSEDPRSLPLTVVEVSESHITLDGNHPLAGVDLTFDIEIVDAREATAEELTHGHAHGPEGHSH